MKIHVRVKLHESRIRRTYFREERHRGPVKYVDKLALKLDADGVCCSIAITRNSSTHTLQSRRRSEDKRSTRITCGIAQSRCKRGGGVSWCAGSWGRIDLRRKRRRSPLRRRNNSFAGALKRTASISDSFNLIVRTTINLSAI